jgi:hypothetical protein
MRDRAIWVKYAERFETEFHRLHADAAFTPALKEIVEGWVRPLIKYSARWSRPKQGCRIW